MIIDINLDKDMEIENENIKYYGHPDKIK